MPQFKPISKKQTSVREREKNKVIRVKLTGHGVKAIAHHEAKANWSVARIKLSDILQITKIAAI